MRLNFSDIVSANLLTSKVFARPGTPISNAWPREKADRQLFDHPILSHNHAGQFFSQAIVRVAQLVNCLNVVLAEALAGWGVNQLRH